MHYDVLGVIDRSGVHQLINKISTNLICEIMSRMNGIFNWLIYENVELAHPLKIELTDKH